MDYRLVTDDTCRSAIVTYESYMSHGMDYKLVTDDTCRSTIVTYRSQMNHRMNYRSVTDESHVGQPLLQMGYI